MIFLYIVQKPLESWVSHGPITISPMFLTPSSPLAQALNSVTDIYLWVYQRDYSKCKIDVLWSNIMNFGVHLTRLNFFIPRSGCNTSKMPRQMWEFVCVCVCLARAVVSICTVYFNVRFFLPPAVMSPKLPQASHLWVLFSWFRKLKVSF